MPSWKIFIERQDIQGNVQGIADLGIAGLAALSGNPELKPSGA
jgi:hypothetical protein